MVEELGHVRPVQLLAVGPVGSGTLVCASLIQLVCLLAGQGVDLLREELGLIVFAIVAGKVVGIGNDVFESLLAISLSLFN